MDVNYPDKDKNANDGRQIFTDADANQVKAAINSKVDKVAGKGLSANDYSNEEKLKVSSNTTAIGLLAGLSTSEKANLVAALNEVNNIVSTLQVAAGNLTANYSLQFDRKRIVTASIGAAMEFTLNTSGLKVGVPMLLVLNGAAGFSPAFNPPFVKKYGDWFQGATNFVELLALSATEIQYEIYQ